jgi:hypothetical protein
MQKKLVTHISVPVSADKKKGDGMKFSFF